MNTSDNTLIDNTFALRMMKLRTLLKSAECSVAIIEVRALYMQKMFVFFLNINKKLHSLDFYPHYSKTDDEIKADAERLIKKYIEEVNNT